ncbi:Protein Malvolio [Blattella germanica]|nr:Protein Malvolio [Blattella germanica]
MANTPDGSGDNKYHVSPAVPSSPSSVATENTMLSPTAKQTYFKENKIQIPESEKLLWLLLSATILGLLMQRLSARLGVVTGLHLAEMCYRQYRKIPRLILWIMVEVAIIGSDMQEVIGTAIALYLLSNKAIPLWGGVLITVVDTFTFLFLDKYGLRKLEFFFGFLITVMAITFGYEYVVAAPEQGQVVKGMFFPWCEDCDSSALLQAVGIVGAVIMPHNLYLHSALVKHQMCIDNNSSHTNMFPKLSELLLLKQNNTDIVEADLYKGGVFLGCAFGSAAMYIWGVGILAAGQSSTMTGTYAERNICYSCNILSEIVGHISSETEEVRKVIENLTGMNDVLNAVMSLQLPFATIPTIAFTSNPQIMGEFVNGRVNKVVSILLSAVVIGINVFFVAHSVIYDMNHHWALLTAVIIYSIGYVAMCIYFIIHMIISMGYSRLGEIRFISRYIKWPDSVDFGLSTQNFSNSVSTFTIQDVMQDNAANTTKEKYYQPPFKM